jgi:hypothetical protein
MDENFKQLAMQHETLQASNVKCEVNQDEFSCGC